MPWYFLTPPTGAILAIAFYLVVRGGFLASGTSAADVNLFAFAGIGVLVRLFADLATSKLEEAFNTVYLTDHRRSSHPTNLTTHRLGQNPSLAD